MAEEYGSARLVDEALKRVNKAKVARRFIKSESGEGIILGIQEEITALLNEIADRRLTHEEYIEKRAQAATLRNLLKTWHTDAASLERYQEIYAQKVRERNERIRLEQAAKS